MIPLRSEQRRSRPPWAALVIGLTCAAASARLASFDPDRARAIIGALALVPARFTATPFAPAQLVTALTSTFLHAGWLHLAGNLLFLAVFAPAVESRLGWRRFLGLYLLCGVAGAVAHAFTHPESTQPLVGASGAIAGVLGAHLVVAPRDRITTLVPVGLFFEVASLPAAFVIGLWFLLQLASGVAPVAPGSGAESIAWFAHIAGFAAGAALAVPLALGAPRTPGRRVKTRRGTRRRG